MGRASEQAVEQAVRGRGAETDFLNAEDVKIPKGMPKPCLWRVIVIPVRPRSKSRGGIELVDVTQDNQEHVTNLGKIVAIGPMAGKKEGWTKEAWPYKVGDWVQYGTYAGQRFEYQGVKAIIMNDDELLTQCEGPEGFRIYNI